MSKQGGDKDKDKGAKKKGGKRRVVIQLPPGSSLDAMSPDDIAKHVQDLVGKAGISGRKDVGGVEELLIETGDKFLPSDSSSSASLAPPEGWGKRWSRFCRD